MKVVSLFSGAGGLDLGFIQAGFNVVWANDIFPPACDTIASNTKYFNAEKYDNPEEKYNGKHRIFCGEIEKIKSFRDAIRSQSIDIVIGGFPCQDFSILRGSESKGRGGVQVKRGRLYCHFVRALAELQPKMFVAENVKGLVTANGGKAYDAIIEDFEHLNDRWGDIKKEYGNFNNSNIKGKKNGFEGYHILLKSVIDFSRFGVPQKRERLIIIGLRKDLYQQMKLKGDFSIDDYEKQLYCKFMRNGLDDLSKFPLTPIEIFYGKTLDKLQDEYKSIMLAFEQSIKEVDSKRQKRYLENVWSYYSLQIWKDYFLNNNYPIPPKNIKPLNAVKEWDVIDEIEKNHKPILEELEYYNQPVDELRNENSEILNEQIQVIERMKHIPPGENHEFVKNTEYHVTGLMSNIYRRVHPLKPSPTVIACGGGGTWGYHYGYNRQKLTNRERARLQTFPDDFVFEGTAGQVRTQIGNAVPPLAGKRIAEELKTILSELKEIS